MEDIREIDLHLAICEALQKEGYNTRTNKGGHGGISAAVCKRDTYVPSVTHVWVSFQRSTHSLRLAEFHIHNMILTIRAYPSESAKRVPENILEINLERPDSIQEAVEFLNERRAHDFRKIVAPLKYKNA